MKALPVLLLVVACLLLSGCLVLFKTPIAALETAPTQLLGNWQRENEWGEQLQLQITAGADHHYVASIRVLGQGAKPLRWRAVASAGTPP
jgi:outer membrane biogenesis lipoprotein LolB